MTPARPLDSETPDPAEYRDCRAMRQVLERVGDRWSLIIVTALSHGPRRFNRLRRDLGSITQRMLTRTLRSLERDGLVTRTVGDGKPPAVEYGLSPLGWSLVGAVRHLLDWAVGHRDALDAARAGYDRAGVRPAVPQPEEATP